MNRLELRIHLSGFEDITDPNNDLEQAFFSDLMVTFRQMKNLLPELK